MYQSTTPKSSWWNVGATLFVGLFVAYIDRANLSVALPKLSSDLGFGGANFAVTKSFALTIFLMGYACANVLGGFITRRSDPKTVVICCFAVWSVATILVGFASSVTVLLGSRLVLGVAEGIYWPQLSRFVRNWFAPQDATRANSIIQYFGQYVALAIGFIVLVPINDAFGWRSMFFITGGLGLVVIVPLFLVFLKTVSLGYYAGSYTPNIWSILQALVEPRAVGVASGIMNGLGAGAGGTLAGFLVGMLQSVTGSYETGFMVLGLLVVFGGIALFVYDRMSGRQPAALAL